ncbi:MAG: TMEM175 family protein, partial [Candidatus Kapaibacterium sp.]
MNKTRLETFSDGVLAIIITIMVLELKMPRGTNWEAIESALPSLGSYLLSFVFIGIYWG